MTRIIEGEKGEGKYFQSPNAAITAYEFDGVGFRSKIHVMPSEGKRYEKFGGKPFETTVGRLFFNSVLPDNYPFINAEIDKKQIVKIIDDLILEYGPDKVAPYVDKIKKFGFRYATYSGTTWGLEDIKVPKEKKAIVKDSKDKVIEVEGQYAEGLLTEEERIIKSVEIWQDAKGKVEKAIAASFDDKSPVYDMWKSGARGSLAQIVQMVGMKGMITNIIGETIEFPVVSSYIEGLTPIEYFITTHGSRKGLTDTALNTAKAGYLTRRLFDVAQDIIITEKDCGVKAGIVIDRGMGMDTGSSIMKKIRGRVLSEDIAGKDGKVMFEKGYLLTKDDAQKVDDEGIQKIHVRSPLACRTLHGICSKCYGMDLGKGILVDIGEAVGTVAAQAIGEPGTQLTMRTFHAGGVSSAGGDITQGLPRVEEIFEKRKPKNPAVVATVTGMVTSVKDFGTEKIIIVVPEVKDDAKGKKGEVEYKFNPKRVPLVKTGDKVHKGDLLTDGSADIDEIFEFGGREKAMEYIINEVSKPYELQGEAVARKHIEIIVKQMFSKKIIKNSGQSNYSVGDIIDELDYANENEEIKAEKGDLIDAKSVVMGITESSLSRRSFLSAASFQHTVRILINAAVRGVKDNLKGLKENVIIGRIIPAGTGFAGSKKNELIQEIKKSISEGDGENE